MTMTEEFSSKQTFVAGSIIGIVGGINIGLSIARTTFTAFAAPNVGAIVLAPFLVTVQPANPQPGEPLYVQFEHVIQFYEKDSSPPRLCSGTAGLECVADTDSYGLEIGGAAVQAATAPMAVQQWYLPDGLPAGSHTIIVRASGLGGSTVSTPFTLTIDPLPGSGVVINAATPWKYAESGDVVTQSVSTIAGQLLIATAVADTGGSAPTMTISSSPSLTWTQKAKNGASQTAQLRIWTATATGANVTVTLKTSGSQMRAVQVYTTNGQVGAVWQTGQSTANNWTPNTYTTTAVGSVGLALAADWFATGLPTTTDIGDAGHVQLGWTGLSWLTAKKASASTAVGQVVPFNFDGLGSANVAWRAVAIEIKP